MTISGTHKATRPAVTMVVPVHNRPQPVLRLLECVKTAWSTSAFNLIVVDNNSTDNTYTTVKEWLDCNIPPEGCSAELLSEHEPGASAARNRGLAAVETDWVMFFDSDDTFLPGHMPMVCNAVNNAGEAGAICWNVTYAPGTKAHKLARTSTGLAEHILHGSLGTQRWCARTGIIRRIGGWNRNLPVWNDYEIGTRLLLYCKKHNTPFLQLTGKPTVHIHITEISITGKDPLAKTHERTLTLNEIEQNLIKESESGLLPLVDGRRMILAAQCYRSGRKKQASELHRTALKNYSPIHRAALECVYLIQRFFGKGGTFVASKLVKICKKQRGIC